ncbi:transposase [Streptomyces sp. NPDC004044]
MIVVASRARTCGPCSHRSACTSDVQWRRKLTLRPQDFHETLAAARADQKTETWKDKYALRAGVEGTINQALDRTGVRRARYRGLPKVRLQHAFSATALNIVRLDAHWTSNPMHRPGTNNLTRLNCQLTA